LASVPVVIPSPKDAEIKKDFPLDHYSSSSMIKFATNPFMFKVNYINRDWIDSATGAKAILGKAFHYAMEVYYGGIDDYAITSEAEAIEFGLKGGMEFIENYNDGFVNYSDKIPNKQKLYDLFSFLFTEYVKYKPYQKDTVVATEKTIKKIISVEWKGENLTFPVPIKGVIDKIIRRKDGKISIVDYKSCEKFSDLEKIDAKKIIQAVNYFFLVYAEYGEAPYSLVFEEVKFTKNRDAEEKQIKEYELVYADNPLFFDFYFRFYGDITGALNGKMVYVPNFDAFYDNELALISYIHRLDISEEQAKLFKKHNVDNITDLLKKEIQVAGNMRQLLKNIENSLVEAKNIDYTKMKNEEKIQTKMMEHGMLIKFDSKIEGASVDLYRYTPSIGLKMSRLKSYADDIQQVLGVGDVRVIAPIPNTSYVGFEVPKEKRKFPDLPKNKGFDIAIGQDIMGNTRFFDVRHAPHIVVAGSTGSGKSHWLNNTLKQLFTIKNSSFYLLDPKKVELSQFEGMKNVTYRDEPVEIENSLCDLVSIMDQRYTKMKEMKVKNISETDLAYIFVVIDEFGDINSKEIQELIRKLAQKGRACGIHLILATQRASTKIINGDIKVNFPVRVVFRMAKRIDSQVMLDEDGAEKLLGKGDMLFLADNGIERLQGFN
jgi:hypothetical protein